MKISKTLVALMIAGSLTTVFAGGNPEVISGKKVKSPLTQEKVSSKMTKQDIRTSIASIKSASADERQELVNDFKSNLMKQSPQVREEAMAMYNQSMPSNESRGQMNMASQNMNQTQMMNQSQVLSQTMGSKSQPTSMNQQPTPNTPTMGTR